MIKRVILSLIAWIVMLAVAGTAHSAGPNLRAPEAELRAALDCPDGLEQPSSGVVLLVHGTFTNEYESWSGGYLKALPKRGYDVCTVRLPRRALGDIQRTSEYVVFSIRRLAARADTKVDVIGHSQGTLQPRWALRWWDDVRLKVDDYISLAGPHHGAQSANELCKVARCAPSVWQQRRGSNFLAALNRGNETPRGPSYTSIFSRDDELVIPHSTSRLSGASNILVQDLCPVRYVSHAGMLWDAVTYWLVVDALENRGPARADRVGNVCGSTFIPGASPPPPPANPVQYGLDAFETWATNWRARDEPPLARYAR
ncbi:MAG: lipase family protein [Actinomycetota bacterium]|nr:lipase family protein [Actinomycetota bacterium]